MYRVICMGSLAVALTLPVVSFAVAGPGRVGNPSQGKRLALP
jgi:hypothetical protein